MAENLPNPSTSKRHMCSSAVLTISWPFQCQGHLGLLRSIQQSVNCQIQSWQTWVRDRDTSGPLCKIRLNAAKYWRDWDCRIFMQHPKHCDSCHACLGTMLRMQHKIPPIPIVPLFEHLPGALHANVHKKEEQENSRSEDDVIWNKNELLMCNLCDHSHHLWV